MDKLKKLMVIDGNSLVNRAFFGMNRNLSTKDGLFTNAIYGFLNILVKLLEDEMPDAVTITFDRAAPTFRHKAYPEYKAQRKGMPEELAMQLKPLKELLSAMNILQFECDGWEADDLIGTIARIDEESGWQTVIVTGDRDSLQLVTDQTTVLYVSSRMGQTTYFHYTPVSFHDQYGFDPIHLIDLKALMGDSSDNIPGVPGIGEKTAMGLLHSHHSLDEIYQSYPNIDAKPAALKKLEAGKDLAYLSYDLATIRKNAPISFVPENAIRKPYNDSELYSILVRLEFTKMIEKLGLNGQREQQLQKSHTTNQRIDVTEENEKDILDRLSHISPISLFLSENDSILAISAMETDYIFTDSIDSVLRAVSGWDIDLILYDYKKWCKLLLGKGIPYFEKVKDVLLMAYVLSPTDGNYSIDKLAISYLKLDISSQVELNLDIEAQKKTAAENARTVYDLFPILQENVEQEHMTSLLETIEVPLCPVLAEMEQEGFLIDRDELEHFGNSLSSRITELEQSIYSYSDHPFNINSTQQLGKVLFDELQLPPVKKTKSGYSTNAEVLEKLKNYHPIIPQILEYRQLTKLKSTYVEGLGKVIDGNGRVHTQFQNTVTATGRLSSTDPNLQNIPVRTELGAEIRKMFHAKDHYLLVDADYSQIELRLLAHIAGDKAMIHAFQSGTDIHTATASQVFGVLPSEVTPLMRRHAKAVNFGIVYGISAFSLSQDIHVSVQEAKDYIDRYFKTFPQIREYMDQVVLNARKQGYVETLYGRKRYLPELNSSNFAMRSFGERVALNAPIQGTAADIIKLAMIQVWKELSKNHLDARLILQVHDELIVEAHEKEAQKVADIVSTVMSKVASLQVELTAEAGIGKNWYEAKA